MYEVCKRNTHDQDSDSDDTRRIKRNVRKSLAAMKKLREQAASYGYSTKKPEQGKKVVSVVHVSRGVNR